MELGRKLFSKTMNSPVGKLTLISSEKDLTAILWENHKLNLLPFVKSAKIESNPSHPVLCEAAKQLEEYFSGRRNRFDLPIEFNGTPFQIKVWGELQRIPWGQTRSYGELAHRIGHPKAYRAVGAANGRNPLSIIVPCHRVIGTNGKLTGFAGGMKAKQFLLDHEKKSGHANLPFN